MKTYTSPISETEARPGHQFDFNGRKWEILHVDTASFRAKTVDNTKEVKQELAVFKFKK